MCKLSHAKTQLLDRKMSWSRFYFEVVKVGRKGREGGREGRRKGIEQFQHPRLDLSWSLTGRSRPFFFLCQF